MVRTILAEQLSLTKEGINLTDNLVDDLGTDSLDSVEIVMAFEEELQWEIADDKAEEIKTVQAIVDYIKEKVPEENYANFPR